MVLGVKKNNPYGTKVGRDKFTSWVDPWETETCIAVQMWRDKTCFTPLQHRTWTVHTTILPCGSCTFDGSWERSGAVLLLLLLPQLRHTKRAIIYRWYPALILACTWLHAAATLVQVVRGYRHGSIKAAAGLSFPITTKPHTNALASSW